MIKYRNDTYRIVEFVNGKFAAERMNRVMWWYRPSGQFLDLRSDMGITWTRGDSYFSDCVTSNKDVVLTKLGGGDYDIKRVVETSKLEKALK